MNNLFTWKKKNNIWNCYPYLSSGEDYARYLIKESNGEFVTLIVSECKIKITDSFSSINDIILEDYMHKCSITDEVFMNIYDSYILLKKKYNLCIHMKTTLQSMEFMIMEYLKHTSLKNAGFLSRYFSANYKVDDYSRGIDMLRQSLCVYKSMEIDMRRMQKAANDNDDPGTMKRCMDIASQEEELVMEMQAKIEWSSYIIEKRYAYKHH